VKSSKWQGNCFTTRYGRCIWWHWNGHEAHDKELTASTFYRSCLCPPKILVMVDNIRVLSISCCDWPQKMRSYIDLFRLRDDLQWLRVNSQEDQVQAVYWSMLLSIANHHITLSLMVVIRLRKLVLCDYDHHVEICYFPELEQRRSGIAYSWLLARQHLIHCHLRSVQPNELFSQILL
jgi:hypothetical protein